MLVYEKPKLIEMNKAAGQISIKANCHVGSGPNWGDTPYRCYYGYQAQDTCQTGAIAGHLWVHAIRVAAMVNITKN
jgi:hypothetical protein